MKKALIFCLVFIIVIMVLYFPINNKKYISENDEYLLTASLNTRIFNSKDTFYLTVVSENKTNETIRMWAKERCFNPVGFEIDKGFSWTHQANSRYGGDACFDAAIIEVSLKPNETIKQKLVIQRDETNSEKVGKITVSSQAVEDIIIQLE